MNRITVKALDVLADFLPDRMQHSTYQKTLKGEDAILAGTLEIDGEKVDPEKDYVVQNNLFREVNHKLRMKKAFKKHGKKGVIHYCKKFVKAEKQNELTNAIDRIL